MTRNCRRKLPKRVIASVLTGMFVLQTGSMSALATTITSGTGSVNAGVYYNSTTGVWELTPGKVSSGNGYSHYSKFDLSSGDTANMIFNTSGKEVTGTFYNMVDGTGITTINGLLNTVNKTGTTSYAFHDGKVVFVTPGGFMVGSSGVLNVGSLSVYTPSADAYNALLEGGSLNGLSTNGGTLFETDLGTSGVDIHGNNLITINGKILATNDIRLNGTSVSIAGSNSALIAGINKSQMKITKDGSEALFNTLVSGDYKNATNFTSSDGTIEIYSNREKSATLPTNLNISGTVKNIADSGKLTIINEVPAGMNISGDVENIGDGTTKIINRLGNMTISGKIATNGYTEIYNSPSIITVNDVTLNALDPNTKFTITDTAEITNEAGLLLSNYGKGGFDIAGKVTGAGGITILNGKEGNGTFGDKTTTINDNMKALNITGTITNEKDTLSIRNYGDGGLILGETGNITSTINDTYFRRVDFEGNVIPTTYIYNGGKDGMTLNGAINNTGDIVVTNDAGAMNIGGNITANGMNREVTNRLGVTTTIIRDAEITNNGTDLNITGNITSNEGKLYITNNGTGALNVQTTAQIDADGMDLINNGAGGLYINGKITNVGDGLYKNTNEDYNIDTNGTIQNSAGTANFIQEGSGAMLFGGTINNQGTTNISNVNLSGPMTIGGKLTNNGATNITNNGFSIDLTGNITNTNEKLTVTNNNGYFNTATDSNINAVDADLLNNGSGAMTLNGTINNTGHTSIINENGTKLTLNGNITNTTGLTMINKGADGFEVNGNINNNAGGIYRNSAGNMTFNAGTVVKNTNANFDNTGDNMTFAGTVENNGITEVLNDGNGALTIGGNFSNNGNTTITSYGSKTDITGYVKNTNGVLTVENNKGGLTIANNATVESNGLMLNNLGENGLLINGTVTNNGATTIYNSAGGIKINGTVTNNGDAEKQLKITNQGGDGITINGTVKNTGTANITNNAAHININGTIDNTGITNITNEDGHINVNEGGTITTKAGKLTILNRGKNGGTYVYGGGKIKNLDNNTKIVNNGVEGITVDGVIENGGVLDIENTGTQGIEVNGTVQSVGKITMNNTGHNGIHIGSTGRITGANDVDIINTPATGTGAVGLFNVMGLVKGKNVNLKTTNGSNLVIGDNQASNNNNYITAENDINITANDASVLNRGVAKVLLNAGGNLNMNVTNGTIGKPVQQKACTGSGCTGIGPMADGSRDFTKSINAKVAGKVNAKTTDAAKAGRDLVINYAAIDSDMNIDAIKADGRVILTVDDDYGANNTGKRYNMVNASTDKTKANVEGWGMSLISNGSIGTKDNKLTFNQTKAPQYAMDALANENIYMKGLDDKYTTNEVCTMIAREGDLDVEFSGNTHIKNITAEGDMTVITRGKNLVVDNIGHIQDSSVTPNDYFGPRHDGYEFDGRYNKADYKSDVLPNNVTLKALDINKNVRPDGEMVDGYYAYADSSVRVNNAVIDNGKMDITADNIYANGIYAGFNRVGFTKIKDPSTNAVIGVVNPASLNEPVGHAVRPNDVTGIGRDEHERNYYYPNGDGDITVNKNNSNVDDNDGIADDTPLKIGDKGEDTPTPPNIKPNVPGGGGGGGNDTSNNTTITGDKSFAWKKVDDNNVEAIDKRQFMRFNVDSSPCPVAMEKSDNGIDQLLDVSRGGIAVAHNNKLKVGDVVPVHLTYADLDIKADVKVVSASTTRAGAEFVNLDKATANKLLYLSLLLEDPALSYNK